MTWLVGNDLVGWFRYYNLHYPLYPASSSDSPNGGHLSSTPEKVTQMGQKKGSGHDLKKVDSIFTLISASNYRNPVS